MSDGGTPSQPSNSPTHTGRDRTALEVAATACRNPEALRGLFLEVLTSDDVFARRAVARNPFADAAMLDRLADDSHVLIVESVAHNMNTPPATLDRIVGITEGLPDPNIRNLVVWTAMLEKVAYHPKLSPRARRALGRHPSATVRRGIADRPDLSDTELIALSDDVEWQVAALIAYRLSLDPTRLPGTLDALRDDESDAVVDAANGKRPWISTSTEYYAKFLRTGFVLARPKPTARKDIPLTPHVASDIAALPAPSDAPQNALAASPQAAPPAAADAKHGREPDSPSNLARLAFTTRRPEDLYRIAADALRGTNPSAQHACASHRKANAETLDLLADSPYFDVIRALVRNPLTTAATLDRILGVNGDIAHPELRDSKQWLGALLTASNHVQLSPPARRAIGTLADHRLRRNVAGRFDVSDGELRWRATDRHAGVRVAVAAALWRDQDRLPELRATLASDAHPYVRDAALGISTADTDARLARETAVDGAQTLGRSLND